MVLQTDGVPAEIVVALVDDAGRETDRRAWNEQFGRPAEPPGSLEAVVARWLTEGEHEQLEYKQTLKETGNAASRSPRPSRRSQTGWRGGPGRGGRRGARPVGYAAAKARDQVANVFGGPHRRAADALNFTRCRSTTVPSSS